MLIAEVLVKILKICFILQNRLSLKDQNWLSLKARFDKSQKLDFAKTNSSKTDLYISEVKETFIYLRKAFIDALTVWYFDPKQHISIKTNTLGYFIGKDLS